eukprot:997988-Rhodomonas_salina.1
MGNTFIKQPHTSSLVGYPSAVAEPGGGLASHDGHHECRWAGTPAQRAGLRQSCVESCCHCGLLPTARVAGGAGSRKQVI